MPKSLRLGRLQLLLALLGLFALPGAAQPVAVLNVASYANPKLPNGNIAQGSMFTVFGTNIGPAALVKVSAFPLPTQLGGTSIKVTSGGITAECIMTFSRSDQVGAVLPSRTPVGDGMLTLTFNGQAGAPIPIKVVAHSFGMNALNEQGSGPGVLTNAINPLSINTIFNSALAGEMWDIWGTGVGAVQGDEAAGPLPGDLPYNVQVLVGSTAAQVVYRGRSGCCTGVDQIRFVVPAGITGCYIPIAVVVEGVASNFTTMAISETAGACSDPSTAITGAVLSRAQTSGKLRIGSVDGSRTRLQFSVPAGLVGQSFTSVTDSVGASFEEFTLAQVERFSGLVNANTSGACTVYEFRNGDGSELEDPISGKALNAGNLTLSGPEPGGPRAIPRATDGFYYELLNPGISFLRALVSSKKPPTKDQFGSTPYYQTGVHTVTGAGGTDVGAFTTTFEVGPALTWTNPTTSIPRASPFTVQWSGGSGDRVVIFGFSAYDFEDDEGSGAAFWCAANRAAGSFTIPQAILGALPPSAIVEGIPAGAFGVGSQSLQQTTFPTMDVGLTSYTDLSFNFGVGYP